MSAPAPTREEYYRILADNLPAETLVVTSLGNASYLWASLRDRPENFYVEDCMGRWEWPPPFRSGTSCARRATAGC